MWTTVLVLAVMTASEPVRIAATIFLVTRPRPLINLIAFWLGGVTTGIATSLFVLLVLRDVANVIVAHLATLFSDSTAARLEVAGGLLCLLGAAWIATGFNPRRRTPERGAVSAPADTAAAEARPGPFARLLNSAEGALETGIPWVGFVAGLSAAGPPPIEFLLALTAIGAAEVSPATQAGATMAYLLVMLTVVEIPIVWLVVRPTQTEALMIRLRDWLRRHRRRNLAVITAALGCGLIGSGLELF